MIRTYTNPVGETPIVMGDPFALWHEGSYYLFGSTCPAEGFQCYRSPDLVRWEPLGWAWRPEPGCFATNLFWAPEVEAYRGRFYLTFSGLARRSGGDLLMMGLAVADEPQGPYATLYGPWFDFGHSTIDGHIFVDDDGTPYLYYSRNGSENGCAYGINYGVRLADDLSGPVGEPVKLGEADQPWELALLPRNRCNEGATVLKRNGVYYMTYSACDTGTLAYGIGCATAAHPLGPWTKYPGNPIAATRLDIGVSAPGHNSIVASPDGTELFCVYHTHADPARPTGDRVVNIDRLVFDDDGGLRLIGPTRTPQPLPSGAA